MKLRSISLRGASLAATFALVLTAPSYAQTGGASSLRADTVRPVNPIVVKAPSEPKAGNFTTEQRFEWFIDNTMGTGSLVAGAIGAGMGTGLNHPNMRGDTGEKFAQQYEMRLAGSLTGSAAEASLGVIWREDPRYFRMPTGSFGKRVRNVIRMTLVAYRSDGSLAPAYARYIGIASSSFLTTSWEEHGYCVHDAVLGTFTGFLGRMGGNAFQEFWPSIKPHLLRHLHPVRL